MKRFNRRACATFSCAAITTLVASHSYAALPTINFDLRVHDTGGKEATVANIGDIVVLDLYATLGGLDANPANDSIQSASGMFRSSTGGLKGDLLGLVPQSPFNVSGSSVGIPADLDSDGDLDIGNNTQGGSGAYSMRANAPVSNPTGNFFLGQVKYTATQIADASTDVNFAVRTTIFGFLVWMDGSPASMGNTASQITATHGAPVTIHGQPAVNPPEVFYLDGVQSSHVTIANNTQVTPGKTLTLAKGFDVTSAGALAGGSLVTATINDTTSGNFGGTMQVGSVAVGTTAAGTFTQAGGYSSMGAVTLGGNGQAALLEVTGGTIGTGTVLISQGGTLRHSGGLGDYDQIDVVNGGAIAVTGGTFNGNGISGIRVGYGSAGSYTQSDGVVNATGLLVGFRNGGANGSGTFALSGGTLNVGGLNIGSHGAVAHGLQTAGTLSAGAGIVVSSDIAGQMSTYQLDGGSIAGSSFTVGITPNGVRCNGLFIQNGGTIDATNGLFLHTDAGKTARYELRGGEASFPYVRHAFHSEHSVTHVRTEYPAEIVQTGGTATMGFLKMDRAATYTMSGGTLTITKQLQMDGTFDFANSTVPLIFAAGSFADFTRGTIQNASAASMTAAKNTLLNFPAGFNPLTSLGHFSTQGLVHYAGQPLEIPPDQTVGGSGTIEGDVTNNGAVSPGNSPGTLVVSGNYTQTATGVALMEIAGTGPDEFDLLNVSGSASVAGTLNVALLDGFVPSADDAFTVLTASALSGTFANAADHIDFGGGRFDVIYSPTGVTLTNFSAVPEPSACVMLAAVGVMGLRRRRSL